MFVGGGGVVDQLTLLAEARAVARAIPGMLGGVIFEGAAQVRATGHGGSEKPCKRFQGVEGKLWVQDGT